MNEDVHSMTRKLVKVLNSLNEKSPNNILSIYFCEKRPKNKYRTFAPQVSNQLQKKILELILPLLIRTLEHPTVLYNPVGVLDESNEIIPAPQVSNVKTLMESLLNKNAYTEIDLINVSKIDFYCIKLVYKGETIYLFRQFKKMSRLRKGIFSQLVNGELKELNSNFLGIDELIDMVLMDDELLIVNHSSLERIFSYRDKFQEMTNLAIDRIVVEDKIANIEQFSEDCMNDVRIMKRFTELMSKERLPQFFDNYDRVPEIVHSLGLDIGFDNDGKMIYRDKSQLSHIINLMSDSYFKSLLADRLGVAELEGALK